MGKAKVTATLPDGTVITRATNRPYLFCLAVKWAHIPGQTNWGVYRMSTRRELLESEINTLKGKPHLDGAEYAIVPVQGA